MNYDKGFFMIPLIFGSIFILAGISMILNAFGINIPVMKFMFALFLIGMGLKIIFFPRMIDRFVMTCHREEKGENNYEVAFSSSTIDLRHFATLTSPKTVYICSKFAHVTVFLPQELPLRVKANVAFGTVDLPGYERGSEYSCLHGAAEPVLTVYITSKFSSVVVKQ